MGRRWNGQREYDPLEHNSLFECSGVSLAVRNLSVALTNSPLPAPLFVKGQLWRLDTRFVKIGHVGKLLVHHRLVVPTLKRAVSRESLSAIKELRQFLTANNAVLVNGFEAA